MGTDMFLTLHLWHEPEVILSLAGICAFGRTEQDGEALFAPQRELSATSTFDAKITTITLPGLVDISSTRLRELLERGGGRKYLLPAVYGYILMHRLYGTKADLKRLDLNAAAGLLLLHDAGQAHPPRHGRGGGGGEAGPALGGRRGACPPGGHPPRLHQVLRTAGAAGYLCKIRGASWTSWSRRP